MSRIFFFDSALGACAIRANKKRHAAVLARRGSQPPSQPAVKPVAVAVKRSRERLMVIAAQAALVLAFVVIGGILVALEGIKEWYARKD